MNADPALILAEHICHTRFTDLPLDAVVAPKRDILDTLSAALGDCAAHAMKPISEDIVERAIRFVLQMEGATEATELVRLFAE